MNDAFRFLGVFLLLVMACESEHVPSTTAVSASASGAPTGAQSAVAAPTVNPDQPQTCAPCHRNVVAEWDESMHARAHHELDPIYAGVRRLRMKREGDKIAKACANCHSPSDLDDVDSTTAKMGVTCRTCHAVSEIKDGSHGAAAFVATAGNLLLGPHDIAASKTPAHATGAAPSHMSDSNRLCNVCHMEMKGPTGIAICSTGVEHARVGGDAKSCVDCHMPMEKGPSGSAVARTTHRSHRFLGPHRAWYENDVSLLRDSVDMQAQLVGAKLTVTLTNKSHHAVPTGFPGRMALVVVEGTKADSSEIDFRAKGGVMRKLYVDEDGKPTLAPWAKELKSDERLRVGETRQVVFDVPQEIVDVRVKLVFRLLPPPLAKKLGIADSVEAKPKVVLERKVAR